MNLDDGRSSGGLRRSPYLTLSDDDIAYLKKEIEAIQADVSVFSFNAGDRTSYMDETDRIYVKSDVIPDPQSNHPRRDKMSSRAVLAHEYYGHRTFKGTKAASSSWNDEFRASYTAARVSPGLSDEDRAYLILDAIERAKAAGVTIKYNKFIRGVLYGDHN